MPWKNSWFQLALVTAIFSAGLLIFDFGRGVSFKLPHSTASGTPTTPPTPTEPTPNPPAPEPTPAPTPAPEPVAPVAGGPTLDKPWQNSLGMVFMPVPGTKVLFSQYDARVQDFAAFVNDTGYDATADMDSSSMDYGWGQNKGFNWKSPGFSQTDDCPVVGVNWADANKFCAWLTSKDQAAGKIASNQSYRLPTQAEWSIAVGSGKYPWGDQWPPPDGAGNYADQSFAQSVSPPIKSVVPGNDGYPRTSPVGKFHPNQYGLYDMGGNVWQWCDDYYDTSMNSADLTNKYPRMAAPSQMYRVIRGASWWADNPQDMLEADNWADAPVALQSAYTDLCMPTVRKDNMGFRPVLVVAP